MRSAQLSGNLGRDPELFSPQNSEYACLKFSIANNDESRKNASGVYENITSWLDIEFWTKKPQEWLKRLTKGTAVVCDCEVKQNVWEDKESGKKRSKIVFTVRRGSFPLILESRPAGSGSSTPPPASPPPADDGFDDDIPF